MDKIDAVVMLITISHPILDEPIRFTNGKEDVVSRDMVFMALPFDFQLPDDNGMEARMVIPFDGRLHHIFAGVNPMPSIKIEVAKFVTPSKVESVLENLKIAQISGSVTDNIINIDMYDKNSFIAPETPPKRGQNEERHS